MKAWRLHAHKINSIRRQISEYNNHVPRAERVSLPPRAKLQAAIGERNRKLYSKIGLKTTWLLQTLLYRGGCIPRRTIDGAQV